MRTVNLDVKLEEHGFLWLLKYKNKNQKHVGYIYSKIQILFFLRRTLQEEKSKKILDIFLEFIIHLVPCDRSVTCE